MKENLSAITKIFSVTAAFFMSSNLYTINILAAGGSSSLTPTGHVTALAHSSASATARTSVNPNGKPETLPQYPAGSGAKFKLVVDNNPTEVTMGFIESSTAKLVIEIRMKSLTDDLLSQVDMYQQFQLGLEGGKMKIQKGILKIPQIEKPQILPPEYMEGFSGVQMKSFLIGSANDMKNKKVGDETVTSNGKTYKTQHYHQTENNQTVDYWLSDEAKPMGIVKIRSTGSGGGQNYTMDLIGPVSGVKSVIDASKAEPLNEMAKAFLPMLMPGLLHNN